MEYILWFCCMMVVLVWSILFAAYLGEWWCWHGVCCLFFADFTGWWSMFGGSDGNAGTGTEHYVCVLYVLEDSVAAMEYVVYF